MEEKGSCRVCVTGGAGFIASWLIKKLLHKGYTVHATLRSLDDEAKVGFLRGLPGADTRMELFEADMNHPHQFEPAIKGCDFVFHVATVFLGLGSQYKDVVKAVVDGISSIAKFCIKSGTVKRLIYTGSVVTASPMNADGNGFNDSMDETRWTPLKLSTAFSDDFLQAYTDAKTLAGKELLLKYGYGVDDEKYYSSMGGMEVVILECGLVGGDTLLPYLSASLTAMVSPATNDEKSFKFLLFLEELLGKIPIVHIEDVCEAHIFCAEQPRMNGRFLCASSYVNSAEIAHYYAQTYPQLHVQEKYLNGPRREINYGSTKLIEKGFKYKYDTLKSVLDDTLDCARRFYNNI
ncbi:hypothetical protein Dimus_006626 [Dionaea muscipula]